MKIKVMVQTETKFSETIDYALIMKKDGQFAILNQHMPLISTINHGYLKLVQGELETFVFISRGAIVFKNNTLSIYAVNAQISHSMEQAKALYDQLTQTLSQQTKKEAVDYSKLEKDLRENIMKSQAGHI